MTAAIRVFLALSLQIAAAVLIGLFMGLAWLTDEKLVIQLAIGMPALLFYGWPLGSLSLLVRIGQRSVTLGTFGLSCLASAMSVPALINATSYSVSHFASSELAPRLPGVLYILDVTGLLLGIAMTFWSFRFTLLRAEDRQPEEGSER